MAFKSEKQKAKFEELVKEGKITQETYEKWVADSGDTKLPERAAQKPKGLIRRVRRTR